MLQAHCGVRGGIGWVIVDNQGTVLLVLKVGAHGDVYR